MGERWRCSPAWPVVDEISAGAGADVGALLLESDDATLQQTDNAQLAMFAIGVLAYRDARTREPELEVGAFAGHSLGEYVALVAAGALSVTAGAALVAARGAAMLESASGVPSTMLVVVGEDTDRAHGLTEKARADGHLVWVANINGPGQVVLSGTSTGIEAAAELVQQEVGLKAVRIPVGGAFHSPLMESARERLTEALADVRFADVHRPVVANVDARPYTRGDSWPDLLVRQLTMPVLWQQGFDTLVTELNCDSVVEYGQAKALTALAKRSNHPVTTAKYDRPPE